MPSTTSTAASTCKSARAARPSGGSRTRTPPRATGWRGARTGRGRFTLACDCPANQGFTVRASLRNQDGDCAVGSRCRPRRGVFGQSHVVLHRAAARWIARSCRRSGYFTAADRPSKVSGHHEPDPLSSGAAFSDCGLDHRRRVHRLRELDGPAEPAAGRARVPEQRAGRHDALYDDRQQHRGDRDGRAARVPGLPAAEHVRRPQRGAGCAGPDRRPLPAGAVPVGDEVQRQSLLPAAARGPGIRRRRAGWGGPEGYPPAQGGYPPAQGGYPEQQQQQPGGYPPGPAGYPPPPAGYPPPAGQQPPQQ